MRRLARVLAVLMLVVLALAAAGLIWIERSFARAWSRDFPALARGLGWPPVEVESASLSLLRGRVEVRGVRVGNPPGYQAPDLLRVAALSAEYSPWSLFAGPPQVHEVRLEGPELTWENRAEGPSNWGAALGGHRVRGRKRAPPPTADVPEAATVRMDLIRVEDAVLRLAGPHAPSNAPPVRLPPCASSAWASRTATPRSACCSN
jgi:uncharacterized protein involved in outer membrane biogenesis